MDDALAEFLDRLAEEVRDQEQHECDHGVDGVRGEDAAVANVGQEHVRGDHYGQRNGDGQS